MNSRIYLLLDIVEQDCAAIIQNLSNQPGVVSVDYLEGKPNLLVLMETANRQALADAMMPLLHSIENSTKELHLMIGKESPLPAPGKLTF